MRKYLFAAVALLVSGAAASAQTTDDRFNLSVLGGWASHPGLTFGASRPDGGDGFNAGARLSYDLGGMLPMSGFSVDADYFFNRADYNTGSAARLDTSSFMGDLTYHAPLNESWNLYGGGGLGAVRDDLGGVVAGGSSTVFGWQALGGVEYQYSPTMAVFAEYRYQNAHDANIGGIAVGNTSNNASMGLKFKL
jgi:opacity protein-like surface antigen